MREAVAIILILLGLAAVGASITLYKADTSQQSPQGPQAGQGGPSTNTTSNANSTCWSLRDRYAATRFIAGYGYDSWINITVSEDGDIIEVIIWYNHAAEKPMAAATPDDYILVKVYIDGSLVWEGHPSGGRVAVNVPARYEDNSDHSIKVYSFTWTCG